MLKKIIILEAVGIFIGLVALILSPITLRVNSVLPHQVDAIVVLGGEQSDRAWLAAELYAEGRAQKVFVTGSNDCALIGRRLRLAGVPAGAICMEMKARNTLENSEFTVSMLRSNSVQSAILVTSWPHSRRALACFKNKGSELILYSAPAGYTPEARHPRLEEWGAVVSEYAKIIRYFALRRIGWQDL